jgi:glycosyltransferase involved in cell wall biosynthesis
MHMSQPHAPRVSVVMPVFNGQRFIAEAVRSVLASRFGDFELLVLDDGSTDDSSAEAMRTGDGDPRLRVIPLSHGGVAAARNAGLAHARGALIANLDADDIMFPERLTRQVAYLDRHPGCVAVGSRALVIDAAGKPVRIGVRVFTHSEIDRAHLDGRGGGIWNPTAMFRKPAAMAAGGYWKELHPTGEDHDFWLRMAEVGQLANLPDVLVRYRIHEGNASVGLNKLEQRLTVTLATLRTTFARRGITDRDPVKGATPPLRAWERWCDRALLRYYSGDRLGAVGPALVGAALRPGAPAARSALRTILFAGPK